jgi:hemoglobin
MTEQTMFEYAGGAPAIRALAATHYGRCVSDPVLAQVFGDEPHRQHVGRLADWLGEVLGGPDAYTREHGYTREHCGHSALLPQHAGRHITEAQRRRFVEVFFEVADDVGLPDHPVFRDRLREYVEWGTAIAIDVSQHDQVGPTSESVPVWGWGPGGPPPALS